jgi:hypothetical protein
MRIMIVAALTALTLHMGAASAQGLPAGAQPPVYGASWAAGQRAQDAAVQPHPGQTQAARSAASAHPQAGG